MSDTARLHFLPWLRAGAATAISAKDPLTGELAANAVLKPWVQIEGQDIVEQTATLRGPGHVTALGAQAIVRMEPAEETRDFENNYFPFVELRPADLPWRYTPASPGDNNQLRPWLVLVVVRQQEGVAIAAEPGAKLPVLRIEAPAVPSRELPDLSDSAAWAHVQTSLPANELAGALKDNESAAVARLICPRYLEPNAAWIACLVPAFDVGKYAGLDEDGSTAAEARPAWDHTASNPTLDETVVRLPVYHRWTFSTGSSGDFESLARRLEADGGEAKLGRVDLDVSNPGPPLPKPPGGRRVLGDFVGALRSPGIERKEIPQQHREWLSGQLKEVIERGASRLAAPAEPPADYDPVKDDPVVAPPLYGSFQADRYEVPTEDRDKQGWMRFLNLLPEFRAIAGLGAAAVRKGQESLIASAWAQAGAFRDAQRVFDQGRLAAEVGRSLARRARQWEPSALLQATQRIHAWIDSPAATHKLAVDLNKSAVPTALISPGFARATRTRTALGRVWSRHAVGAGRASPLAAATRTFLEATSPGVRAEIRAALDFAKTSLPAGAWTQDETLKDIATYLSSQTAEPALPRRGAAASLPSPVEIVGLKGDRFDGTVAGAAKLGRDLLEALSTTGETVAPLREVLDLSAAADAVITQFDPLRSIQTGMVARIPALSGLITAAGALPGRLVLHPVFTDPLSLDLVRLDPRYLVPGADELRNNRVTLLEADDDFVAAFLAGANHEMSRELIWREFPASPRLTFFHRFWDTGESGRDDIGEISSWQRPSLGGNLIGVTAEALTVILIRGDIVKRYPEAHVYLTQGKRSDDGVLPDGATFSEPLLQGRLDRRTVFYGFAISPEKMRGNRSKRSAKESPEAAGWFVTIEEPAHGPRFGLDAPADDGSDLRSAPTDWRALTWGHLVDTENGDTLADLRFAIAREPLPKRTTLSKGRLKWGHNAAHMAAITWQRPFRLYIHADRLVPE